MQEPCFELQAAAIPVSNYVDDGFTAAATRLSCLWQAIFAVLLQAALGAFHGLAKCQIEPVLVIKWLGFPVDSKNERFEVAESKINKLKETLRLALAKQSVSSRDLAQVAGKIISLSPAVAPASLYSRAFFQAIKGNASWDALFPNPLEVRQTLQFWLDNLDVFNGRPWWPRPVGLQAVVDASGVGFGGVLTVPPSPPVQFQGTFSESEAKGSSTLREVLGYVGAVELAAQAALGQLSGASLLITGDNQGAVSCVNNLRSPVPAINDAIRRLFDISARLQCDILACWVLRDSIAEADALSREPDASDWGLDPELYAQTCRRFGVIPGVDLFASDTYHLASLFAFRVFTKGCAGVDAFQLNWAEFVGEHTAWVFPPLRAVSQALSLIELHRIQALVVMPSSTAANEYIQLQQLTRASISGPFTIPRAVQSLHASSRVPAGTLNPALIGLAVFRVSWT